MPGDPLVLTSQNWVIWQLLCTQMSWILGWAERHISLCMTHPPARGSLGNALLRMNPWPGQSTLCQPMLSHQLQMLITGPHWSLHRCTVHSHHNCLNSASSCCHVWSPRTFVYIVGKRSHHRHKTWDPSRDDKRRERWNRPTFSLGVPGHHRGHSRWGWTWGPDSALPLTSLGNCRLNFSEPL